MRMKDDAESQHEPQWLKHGHKDSITPGQSRLRSLFHRPIGAAATPAEPLLARDTIPPETQFQLTARFIGSPLPERQVLCSNKISQFSESLD